MKASRKLAGALILLVLILVLGAFGWVQVEFVFAGNLSATDLHPTLSSEVAGFWNADHLWFHTFQIFKVLGLVLFVVGFSWILAECDKFREEQLPTTISVGEKRVIRR